MGFLDLFKPKWRHSDAQVRAEAVKQFGSDDAALLKKIVEGDPDVRVRRIALKKIDDWAVLGALAERDPDEGLRRDAGEKAAELLVARAIAGEDQARAEESLARLQPARSLAEVARRAAFPSVRRGALGRIDDPKALAEVARRAEDPQIRLAAVERLSEVASLRDVAIHDTVKEVALAAVARVGDREALELINKRSKSKAVKAAAREKIDAHKREDEPQAELRTRHAQLCRAVESAAAGDELEAAAQEIESARAEWEALGAALEPLQRRFDRALGRFRERREEHQRRSHKRADTDAQVKRALDETIPAPRAEEARPVREEESPAAVTRAEESGPSPEEKLRREEEQRRRDEERARRDAEKNEERKRKEDEAQANLQRVNDLTSRLEALAGTEDRKRAEKALKDAQAAISSVGPLPREGQTEARARFQAAREKLHIRVQELRDTDDWKRWANVPLLEALCARMDALLTVEDLKQAAADLKTLQGEWKAVGAAPKEKSEALWARFKAAGDQVYERVKALHAALDETRGANLKKKEELCARVEALVDSTDWKETAETIKALQEEWKAVGQVPKEQADAIWKRFREACDKFFERRKEHFAKLDDERAGNLKRQESLIAKVEGLADSTDWRGAADQIKAAQAEWKEIGPAPKEHAEASWRRFREACDKFFERRKEHFAKLDGERDANLKAKQALIGLAEALVAESDRAAAAERVKKLQAEWKEIGPAPKDLADELAEQFRVACEAAQKGRKAPEPAAPPVEKGPPRKFENKLPLGDLAQKLGAATAEAAPAEKAAPKEKAAKAEKPAKKTKAAAKAEPAKPAEPAPAEKIAAIAPAEKIAPHATAEKPAPATTEKIAATATAEKAAPAPAEKITAPAPLEKIAAPAVVEKIAAHATAEKVATHATAEKIAAPAPVEKVAAPAVVEKITAVAEIAATAVDASVDAGWAELAAEEPPAGSKK